MAFAKATLVQRIRNLIDEQLFYDVCTEAMDTTETGLDVADGTKYDRGSMVEFTDDGEQCRVTTQPGANTLTVIRGINSSTVGTGTAHSINTTIVRDPRFTYIQIVDAIESTIRGNLWPYVYKLLAKDITPVVGRKYYDVTGALMMEISSASQERGTTGDTATLVRYGERGSAYTIELLNNLPTAKAASGQGLYIPHIADMTNHIFVKGIAKVTTDVAALNYSDFDDLGSQIDTIVYGAVARLVAGKDIPRTTGEDTTMGDVGVVAGRRTDVSQYWTRRMVEARNQWQMELELQLPRLPIYNRGGKARRRHV